MFLSVVQTVRFKETGSFVDVVNTILSTISMSVQNLKFVSV